MEYRNAYFDLIKVQVKLAKQQNSNMVNLTSLIGQIRKQQLDEKAPHKGVATTHQNMNIVEDEAEEVKDPSDSFDQLIRQQSYYHNQVSRGSKGKGNTTEFAMDVIKARSRNAMLMSGTTSNGSKESSGPGGSFKRTRIVIKPSQGTRNSFYP